MTTMEPKASPTMQPTSPIDSLRHLEQRLQRWDQQHRRQQQRADGEGAQQELVVPEGPGEEHRTAGLAA